MPKIDGNTSEMLSTTLPCPLSAKRPASQLIGSKPTQKKWHQSSRPREMPWQHTKPTPVIWTSRFSMLLAAKSSSVPGNAPVTIGFSSAPRFRLQLTPATSRWCIMASSRHWAQCKKKKKNPPKKTPQTNKQTKKKKKKKNPKNNYPFEISHWGGDSRQRTTDGALGRTLHWAIYKGKCSHRRRPECHRVPSRTGGAWQRTNHRRTQQSPGLSCLWQGTRERRYSRWSTEVLQRHSSLRWMKSSASDGVKAKYHKTWGMLTSSHCTKIKATEAIAIIIAAYLSSVSLGRSLHV